MQATFPSIVLCMFPLAEIVTKLEKLAVTTSRSEGSLLLRPPTLGALFETDISKGAGYCYFFCCYCHRAAGDSSGKNDDQTILRLRWRAGG